MTRQHRSCDHPECVAARAKYAKQWRLDRHRGIRRTIDPTEATLHVATLQGAGWSARAIAAAAEVAPQTVTRLIRGDAKSVGRDTAAKILAVNPEQVPAKASHQTTEPFVPRIGTNRRIQAMLAMGWPLTYLHDVYGINTATLYQQGTWVTRTTHDKVARAYADLAHRRGPSERTRSRARAKGYLDPLAWDDIDHDAEPDISEHHDDGEIDQAVIVRILGGDYGVTATTAERQAVAHAWVDTGRSLNDLARLTGWRVDRYFRFTDLQEAS